MHDYMTEVVTALRTIAPHFQRSINLTYDAGNADYISGYIPTERGATALAQILRNTRPVGRERAHVIHAPYGSGKSLLSLVLSAIVSKDPDCDTAITTVINRLERHYPESTASVGDFYHSDHCLLPVILSGDESSLTVALTRGLSRAVSKLGLGDFRPRTQFQSALAIIERWERLYPNAFLNLQAQLSERGHTLEALVQALQDAQPEALDLFEEIHLSVTAGAHFDGYAHASLTDAYHETAQALRKVGFDGVFIIWDEFGRFMEAKAGEAFGNEVVLLQEFAEFCNRSGEAQVHLVLVTHRQLSTYASDLPTSYQQEWARIAERFRAHHVTSDPATVYRLIAEAFETTDVALWQRFIDTHDEHFRAHTTQALEYNLFSGVDDVALRQQIIEQTWPLHPLTVYALPRLSSQVAQNERTLFTFLAADESDTLQNYLTAHSLNEQKLAWWSVGIDATWDYFAEGIRMDTRPGGSHATWSGVMYALGKIAPDDILGQQIVKALGVLTIIGDVNVQTQWDAMGKIVPSVDLIAWAVDASIDSVQSYLETLSRRRVVAYRQADGYWTFTRGSDVDLEQEVANLIAKTTPNRLQLRQLLQTDAPLPFHLPRGHNLKRYITRYFRSIYRWVNELNVPLGSNESLKRLGGNQGFADGVVVYVLALTSVERQEAIETIKQQPPGGVVYVVPERQLLIMEPLQELFALRELQNNPQFIERDTERLPRELAFFVEDAQRRLQRALRPLIGYDGVTWFYYSGGGWQAQSIRHRGHISRLLTELCETRFAQTPIFNNESLNLHKPSQQQINATEKVIDYLIKRQDDNLFPFDLGIIGYGPDRLILRTMLVQTELLQPVDGPEPLDETPHQWVLKRPRNEALAEVWDVVDEFLDLAKEDEQEVASLIERLQLSPFGMRQGTLPIVLAAIMRPHLQVITLRQQRQEVSPITGHTFTEMCRHPEDFTIEVGVWDARREALWHVLEHRIFGFLAAQEHELQPLSYLSIGLLRWLQSLPRYCRDTQQLSPDALKFRSLIRKSQREPARVLLYELLDLLGEGKVPVENDAEYRQALHNRLSRLMDEIADAYQALRYELDRFAEIEFVTNKGKRLREGHAIFKHWLEHLDEQVDGGIGSIRFSDALVQRFVNALREDGEQSRFWERLSFAVLGISTSDWNDRSVTNFKETLLAARERLQRELFAIEEDEEIIELHVTRPDTGERLYRFRPSDLSEQGQMILENFKSTIAVAGRPLSPDEKRQVALAFLHYILEGDDPGHERKNRSLRRRI